MDNLPELSVNDAPVASLAPNQLATHPSPGGIRPVQSSTHSYGARMICSHAQQTNCHLVFSSKACCLSVESRNCRPPEDVRRVFVKNLSLRITPAQIRIASGCDL